MSLFKQRLLAIGLFLIVAYTGNLLISLESSREQQVAQLRSHAQNAATALGLSLGNHVDDPQMTELLVSAIFDSGYFEHIRVVDPVGEQVLATREAIGEQALVPAWFARLIDLPVVQAEALVSRGWQQAARVQVASTPRFALATLWHAALGSLFWLALCGVISALLGGWLLRYQLRPLDALVDQAEALERREFVSQPKLPASPELRRVVSAMNHMVARLRGQFEEHARNVEALRDEAYVDPLTGLANRRSFEMRLRARLADEEAVRHGFLAVLRIRDLAGLNQRLGGEPVDRLICHLASLLRARCAELLQPALLARIRGGEFALLLPGLLADEAETLAERLQSDLDDLRATTREGPLAYLGLVPFGAGDDMQALMRLADEALAAIDGLASAQWHRLQRSDLDDTLEERHLWQARLEQALEQRRFLLHFQPVVEARDPDNLLHYKVVARLPDAQGRCLPAGRFLPWLERFGWMARFDRVMLSLVLEQMGSHRLPLSLSLSAASLESAQAQADLLALLRRHTALSSRLTLELAGNRPLPAAQLESLAHSLRRLGFALSLQHFGGRFGVLGSLSRLGLAWLKVDGGYIQHIAREEDKRCFLAALQQTARSIDLPLIAEWVETPEELQVLRVLGFQGGMGRLFGEPAPWNALPTGVPVPDQA